MDQTKHTSVGGAATSSNAPPTKNIIEMAAAAAYLTTFAAAVKVAGLTEVLSGKGPYTVFAPTDEAFKKLPAGSYEALLKDPGRLKAVLQYHVISGHFMARDLKPGEVMTLQGTPLSVVTSSSDTRVNGAPVSKVDGIATNGVIHGIDAVILPKNWQLLAAAA